MTTSVNLYKTYNSMKTACEIQYNNMTQKSK